MGARWGLGHGDSLMEVCSFQSILRGFPFDWTPKQQQLLERRFGIRNPKSEAQPRLKYRIRECLVWNYCFHQD